MDVQLVIGAGAIGSAPAQLLADRGERVRLRRRRHVRTLAQLRHFDLPRSALGRAEVRAISSIDPREHRIRTTGSAVTRSTTVAHQVVNGGRNLTPYRRHGSVFNRR
jgi:hypothetical protein